MTRSRRRFRSAAHRPSACANSSGCKASTQRTQRQSWIDHGLRIRLVTYSSNGSSYNRNMARGWESKAVEAQIEAAAETSSHAGKAVNPAELERKRERDGLLLSRARVVHQLESARNPNHRKML